ncbi:MAG: nucleoside deaminase [Planctomycetota bacterium]
MTDQTLHERFMRRAIALAASNPAAPFAAIIVDMHTNEIIAEGINRHRDNPTWHGEIDAINRCAARGPDTDWAGSRLYTSAEPCCMCQAAILWAGISEVVFGTSIRTLQRLGWKQIDIVAEEVTRRTPFARCHLVGGILEAECDQLFRRATGARGDVSDE